MTVVYLAGKIAKNDWRHEVAPDLRSAGIGYAALNDQWKPISTIVDGVYCSGPFFTGCDHGCAHSPSTHGRLPDPICGETSDPDSLKDTHSRCLNAIDNCDVFFMWLSNESGSVATTAYGSLVELGYASARGKAVIIATDHAERDLFASNPLRDLWFSLASANAIFHSSSPVQAFHMAMNKASLEGQRKKLESPLEHQFFNAWRRSSLAPELKDLVVQHKVTANGKNYRLDFAIPEKKIAFEMDGRTYHDTDKAFNRDRRRDLNLELAGWRVHRFDGDMIRQDPDNVVRVAAKLAGDAR